nr:MAG TPA: hypothetical protein [Caudoviricetes sp.]
MLTIVDGYFYDAAERFTTSFYLLSGLYAAIGYPLRS